MPRRRAAVLAIGPATAILVVLLSWARSLDPLPNGLRAEYFTNVDWSGNPAKVAVDASPSTAAFTTHAGGLAFPQFSASWSGWIVAPGDDVYTFATTSDDGSWVYVDNALVVDNGGAHPSTTKTGPTIRLARGPHAVFVRYFQDGGSAELTWVWQRGSGRFNPVAPWALRPRRIGFARFAIDGALEMLEADALWIGAAMLLAFLFVAFRPEIGTAASDARVTIATLAREGVWPALAWVVAGSVALNAVGLWWGLPHGTWVGDELLPIEVLSAAAVHFSHGWHDKYPPMQHYLLTLVYRPVLAVDTVLELSPTAIETALMAAGRSLSVVMAAVTVIATFFCGRRAFGPRAGLCAAGVLALVAPFVYYAKVANVDIGYIMWFAICLAFYLRVLDRGAPADYFWWAATGTLAVCSKDQVYGFIAGMPLVVVVEQARANARAGNAHPWREAVVNRRIGIATITAVVLFAACHNLLWNAAGFANHIRILFSSESYQVYPSTLIGRLTVAWVMLRLIERNFGWPMFAAVVSGVVVAFATRSQHRTAVRLMVPIVSYYLLFINVVLFLYDRFLLAVCLILALFAGYALARFTERTASFRWRAAVVAAMIAYTVLYSGTVDALMLTDSRHAAERWLEAHVGAGEAIAMSSVATYMPRLDRFDATEVYDREKFDETRPRFYVLNVDYALTEPPTTPLGQIIGEVRRSYRLVFRTVDARPLRWLPGGHVDLVGDRTDPEMLSFLRNISPTIEVYERQ